MGLDFQDLEKKETLFVIDDQEFDLFAKTLFDEFNSKFGNLIDLYSDFNLYKSHLEYLFLKSKDEQNVRLKEFNTFLNNCLISNVLIKVIGD